MACIREAEARSSARGAMSVRCSRAHAWENDLRTSDSQSATCYISHDLHLRTPISCRPCSRRASTAHSHRPSCRGNGALFILGSACPTGGTRHDNLIRQTPLVLVSCTAAFQSTTVPPRVCAPPCQYRCVRDRPRPCVCQWVAPFPVTTTPTMRAPMPCRSRARACGTIWWMPRNTPTCCRRVWVAMTTSALVLAHQTRRPKTRARKAIAYLPATWAPPRNSTRDASTTRIQVRATMPPF